MHDLAPGVAAGGRSTTAQLDRLLSAVSGSVTSIGGLLLMLAAIE